MDVTLAQFQKKHYQNLSAEPLPKFFSDIMQAWTQETFRQQILKLSKKSGAPVSLFF